MKVHNRLFVAFFLFMGCFLENVHCGLEDFSGESQAKKIKIQSNDDPLQAYYLPKTHPLHAQLEGLFTNPEMFKSPLKFRKAGFTVIPGHKQLMVGGHPSLPGYLFKKFPDSRPQDKQLRNFIQRIDGSKVLRTSIKAHNFKHLVVPRKWLYKLPESFPNSYILIVERMDICTPEEVENQYRLIQKDVLMELCTILHEVGGCDAYPRNQPFTRSGKIAFVDTEHVGHLKQGFFKHIVPALNEPMQKYAISLWKQLNRGKKATVDVQ